MLPFLQFPWRLLGASAAMLAVLGGVGTSLILQYVPRRFSGWVVAGIVAIILLAAMPLVHVPPWSDDFGETTPQRVLEYEIKGLWLGTTSTADFVPSTVDVLPKPERSMLDNFNAGEPLDRVNRATLPQTTEVVSEPLTPLKTRYHVSSEQDFLLRLFQFDFPGWQATIDGEEVDTELGRPEGFLIVPIPAGDHVVEVRFGNTGVRQFSLMVSAISLVSTLVIAWQFAKYRKDSSILTLDESRDVVDDGASIWPIVGLSSLILVAYVFLIEPSAVMRYDSSDFEAQPAQYDAFGNFGDQIALIGYDFDPNDINPGDQADVTLYWKAMSPMDINYQVFVHLLDENGQIIAQSDKLNPSDFPTRRWPIDKYVRDEHILDIPENLAPGDYSLSAGLWVAADGWRLPLLGGSGEQVDDKFRLHKALDEPAE
jgi:hypothetical protein